MRPRGEVFTNIGGHRCFFSTFRRYHYSYGLSSTFVTKAHPWGAAPSPRKAPLDHPVFEAKLRLMVTRLPPKSATKDEREAALFDALADYDDALSKYDGKKCVEILHRLTIRLTGQSPAEFIKDFEDR